MIVTQKAFDKWAIVFFGCIGIALLTRSFAHEGIL
jgi:hypothetical protein